MMKKLLFFMTLLLSVVVSCENDLTMPNADIVRPSFTTIAADKVGDASALLVSQFSYDGAGKIYEVGFALKKEATDGNYSDRNSDIWGSGKAMLALKGLDFETEYRYYSYMIIGGERFNSISRTFKTLKDGEVPMPSVPIFGSPISSEVTKSGATIACDLSYMGEGEISEIGFEYQKGDATAIYQVKLSNTVENKSAELTGLEEGITCAYYLYVVLDGQRYKSGEASFTTLTSEGGGETGFKYSGCLEMPAANYGTLSTFKETYGGTTGFKYSVTGNANQTIVNHTISDGGKVKRNYTMLYDKTKFGALWVSYIMHKGYHSDSDVGRTDDWTNDPAISAADQQTGASYGSKGYSRGHQIASNDRQNTKASNQQTFYHTNILPQWQNSFNGGVWSSLENAVQGWAPAAGVRDSIYVVTGPVYKEDKGTISAGGRTIKIPSHYYKAVIKCKFTGSDVSSAQGIGFYFENREHKGAQYSDAEYVKSIDWIEEQIDLDIFVNLPDGVESVIEKNANLSAFTSF